MPNEEQAGDHLPPELLAEIFLQVVPAPRRFYTENSTKLQDYDHKSIFALSQVCSYWRSVALSTAVLWTTIPFIYGKYRKNCRSDGFLSLIRLFIERSGSTPIHITISIHRRAYYYRLTDEPIPHPAIDLILSHSHRWKSAIVHFDPALFPLLGKLESKDKSLLPVLEGLNVKSHYRPVQYDTDSRNIFTNAPALRHAVFDGRWTHYSLNFPWSQLTTYVGQPAEMDSLRPASAHLTTLVLRGSLSMIYPSSSLQFPQLTTLRVEYTKHPYPLTFLIDPNTVFRYIVAPNLLSLEISDHPSHARVPKIVQHLISTTLSQCSTLQSLSFHVAGLTFGLLERLLDKTPSLLSLDVNDISPNGFLSLIFKTTLTPNGLCTPRVPQLESLTIRGLLDLNVGPLVDIYISRHITSQGDVQTKVPCIKLRYPSNFACFEAYDQIENWTIHKDHEKGSEYIKMIGWRNYLAKQFLSRVYNVAKKYAITGTPARWETFLCQDMSKMDTFFKVIEGYQLEDVKLLEVSRLTTIMHDISEMRDGVIPEDNIYSFRQRARSLMDKWTLLLDVINMKRRWVLQDDGLSWRPMNVRRGWVVEDDGLSLRLVGSVEYQ